jgi:hypothetical protein
MKTNRKPKEEHGNIENKRKEKKKTPQTPRREFMKNKITSCAELR